jgi:RNA recognition motif-containing protein
MCKPSGIAFVEFSKASEAQKALDSENGQDLDGRALNLKFSGGAP